MLIKVDDNYNSDVILKLLEENGFKGAREVSWEDEFIDCEVEYRKESDSDGYLDESIANTEKIIRDKLNENADNVIDNEYLSRLWYSYLDNFELALSLREDNAGSYSSDEINRVYDLVVNEISDDKLHNSDEIIDRWNLLLNI